MMRAGAVMTVGIFPQSGPTRFYSLRAITVTPGDPTLNDEEALVVKFRVAEDKCKKRSSGNQACTIKSKTANYFDNPDGGSDVLALHTGYADSISAGDVDLGAPDKGSWHKLENLFDSVVGEYWMSMQIGTLKATATTVDDAIVLTTDFGADDYATVFSSTIHYNEDHTAGPKVRARPGRLSALRIFDSKSVLCGAFVWVRTALNRPETAISGPGRCPTPAASTRSPRGASPGTPLPPPAPPLTPTPPSRSRAPLWCVSPSCRATPSWHCISGAVKKNELYSAAQIVGPGRCQGFSDKMLGQVAQFGPTLRTLCSAVHDTVARGNPQDATTIHVDPATMPGAVDPFRPSDFWQFEAPVQAQSLRFTCGLGTPSPPAVKSSMHHPVHFLSDPLQ